MEVVGISVGDEVGAPVGYPVGTAVGAIVELVGSSVIAELGCPLTLVGVDVVTGALVVAKEGLKVGTEDG